MLILFAIILIITVGLLMILFGKWRKAKIIQQQLLTENTLMKKTNSQHEHSGDALRVKEAELEMQLSELNTRQKNIEQEKYKIEEKNKKIWQMSEAALKEKHRLEEANVSLQTEKEKLEFEKKKLDEKIKKLWQTSTSIHKEKERINTLYEIIEEAKKRSDDLLLNILPAEAAEELKSTGKYIPRLFNNVSVIFTDFKGFTTFSEKCSPGELVNELNGCFMAFDRIIDKYNIEKIKTVGDAYMAVSGLPLETPCHAVDLVAAAVEIRDFMLQRRAEMGDATFEVRIGIHSGSVVAGIVGIKKYAYDVWGDTVNIAARMEQSSEPGKINISETTFQLVKDKYYCQNRGKVEAKNKGMIDMYFVEHYK